MGQNNLMVQLVDEDLKVEDSLSFRDLSHHSHFYDVNNRIRTQIIETQAEH